MAHGLKDLVKQAHGLRIPSEELSRISCSVPAFCIARTLRFAILSLPEVVRMVTASVPARRKIPPSGCRLLPHKSVIFCAMRSSSPLRTIVRIWSWKTRLKSSIPACSGAKIPILLLSMSVGLKHFFQIDGVGAPSDQPALRHPNSLTGKNPRPSRAYSLTDP
jgi:hypothetical protein